MVYRYVYAVSVSIVFCFLYFFFFQAEDGIRDGHVTGVQTCALPISLGVDDPSRSCKVNTTSGSSTPRARRSSATCRWGRASAAAGRRSEERRVGKECRSRWSADHEKKNK